MTYSSKKRRNWIYASSTRCVLTHFSFSIVIDFLELLRWSCDNHHRQLLNWFDYKRSLFSTCDSTRKWKRPVFIEGDAMVNGNLFLLLQLVIESCRWPSSTRSTVWFDVGNSEMMQHGHIIQNKPGENRSMGDWRRYIARNGATHIATPYPHRAAISRQFRSVWCDTQKSQNEQIGE